EELSGGETEEQRTHPSAGAVPDSAVAADERHGGVQREPRGEDGEAAGREEQGTGRGDDGGGGADDRRSEDEGGLVGRAPVGEGGGEELEALATLRAGELAPAHPGQRADLRHEDAGDAADHGEQLPWDVLPGQDDEGEERQRAAHRLDEEHGTLADPVGERARQRGGEGVDDGEG